jgi:uncharacterized membrane protein YjdF
MRLGRRARRTINVGLATANLMDAWLYSDNRFNLVYNVKETEMKRIAIAFFLFVGCVYLLIHFDVMFDPGNIFYEATSNFDKVEHLTSGFVLAGLVMSIINCKQRARSAYTAFITVLVLGVIFEIVEFHTVYGGFPDALFDIVFNQIGALLGIFTAQLFKS